MALGVGRARHGPLGIAAVRRLAVLCGSLCVLAATGCTMSSFGSGVGAAAGVASSAATANPAVGYAVAVGTQAAIDASVKYVLRTWKNDQQNLMARVAGALPPGQVKAWEVRRSIPYGNERGSIQVVREIDNPLASCREVLFTVESDETESAYLASICRQEGGWRWASAEPAVLRWGALQ